MIAGGAEPSALQSLSRRVKLSMSTCAPVRSLVQIDSRARVTPDPNLPHRCLSWSLHKKTSFRWCRFDERLDSKGMARV